MLACGCRKVVRTADLRLCPSGGHVRWISGTARSTRMVLSLTRSGSSREGLTGGLRRSNRFAVLAPLAIRSFVGASASSGQTAGIATDPIRSREAPAQHARTSFRHPQGGATRRPARVAALTIAGFECSLPNGTEHHQHHPCRSSLGYRPQSRCDLRGYRNASASACDGVFDLPVARHRGEMLSTVTPRLRSAGPWCGVR
jgi:hypothetical protein